MSTPLPSPHPTRRPGSRSFPAPKAVTKERGRVQGGVRHTWADRGTAHPLASRACAETKTKEAGAHPPQNGDRCWRMTWRTELLPPALGLLISKNGWWRFHPRIRSNEISRDSEMLSECHQVIGAPRSQMGQSLPPPTP